MADCVPPKEDKALASAQPRFSGYRIQEIRDWTPEADPHAAFLRSRVPLQPRIAALRETQADPSLDGHAQVMLMQADYGNAFFDTAMANDDFCNHALNFWGYVDYFSPWHGAATADTPSALYDPETSHWRNRGFEFGIVNIPNPAYTDAAHRNGVRSIGTIYFDPDFRPGLTFHETFLRDPDTNGYVILEKLVELAAYCGFDSYFLNQEEHGDDSEFKPFMAELTARGLYTQWYDQNSFYDEAKAAWLRDEANGQIHDSVFVNYEWSEDVDRSLNHAAATGVDPFDSLFFGVEACMGKLSGAHPSLADLPMLYAAGTRNPRGSVALFTPSDYYQMGLDEGLAATRGQGDPPLMQQEPYQWMVTERERMFFSGVRADPTRTGKQQGASRPEVGVDDASGWVGVADFTPERSVIGGTDFHSTFNTGHGMAWYDDGEVTGGQWGDIGSQSLLPSWQWWIDTDGARPGVDFDYGPWQPRRDASGREVEAPFFGIGAWFGGSSLVIHGDITATTTLRLFKTDLNIGGSTTARLTLRKSGAEDPAPGLLLVFADDPHTPVVVDLPVTSTSIGWTTVEVPLDRFAGRRLATIGLQFAPAVGYQVNVGQIAISSGAAAPAAPRGFELTAVYADRQLKAEWELAPFGDVDGYLLTAIGGDGSARHLYQGYAERAYAKRAPTDALVRYELRAIAKDGALSAPVTLTHDFAAFPSDLRIEEAPTASGLLVQAARPGLVDVRWDPAVDDRRRCRVSVALVDEPDPRLRGPFEVEVPLAVGQASVPVPVAEGHLFDLTLTPEGESTGIVVRGHTRDTVAAPLPLSDLELVDGALVVHSPSPRDWWKLRVTHVREDGSDVELLSVTRGDASNAGLQDPRPLTSLDGHLVVELTDYSGNLGTQPIPVAALSKG
ncbi:Endo-beta-N-acetylglucosaminidase D [Tessaracoccus bendigoensis DSM 12906]|uniref:Endo-beta-N-acetylglucosaminidase D n=1 Tax=Tessaracoccus bendigoensis DSM 12906 TaxID=1123357 RepID=A0A1M6B8X0_9ACTN|nr:hypothetical protein [Tessaracoccus bendigoensis]SHI45189.1 Endo-beta-N-acetylglucosaminidase D [Tessaracoccus bendigoensis DSM 12906]